MRKFFSFFAALLFAGSMMAEEATMTAGTNGSACTVNDVAGIKCGTSKAGGDMTITVGAGATKLSFYAAAWKGVTGLSLNLAADGVTFSPASVSLTADDGISNNTPFTLSGLPENFKFEVELTGVTAETTIAVTSSAAKRFVVWGASYEAGEAPSVATPVISGDETFTESVIVTITCSTPEADIYYTTDGTTDPKCDCPAAPEYTQQIVLTETTTIMAAAYTGNDWSAVATKTFTKVEPLPEPTDCATAAAAALSVSANNELYNDGAVYTIQGYVTSIKTAYSDQYHNISFWMADTQEGGEVLQAYRAACETEADAPAVGDKVAVTGSLTKYGTTPEFAAGCTFEIIGDDPVHTYTVAGSPAALFGSEWIPADENNDMTPMLGGDLYVWRKDSVNLTAGNIEFKVCEDHGWDKAYPAQNYILNIAEAGYYNILIRFNPKAEEPDSMIIAGATKVGDAPQPADVWDEIVFTEVTDAGVFNDSIFTVEGSEFSLKCVDTENSKLKTTSNNASFGSLDERHDYTIRLQTSGKSGSKNNMELNIPADGKLRIAVRTGSSSDLTRTLVLAQGNDTICNKILLDTDTVPGASSPKIFNFIYVDVKAGKVAVTYPVNAINFYSFAFKAELVPPTPEHTYTVAGGSDVLFGTTWAPANTANDMALVEGLYTWEKSELTLAAGNIEFKVCEDHGWDVAYPAQNYELAIAEAGIYTITITFNAETKEVNAVATKTGEAVVVPTVAMHGNFLGSWADTENFAIAQDNASASLTLTLAEGNYEFGMRIGGSGNWTANGANLTREANTTNLAEGSGNMHIAADVAGDYVFTYTYETQVLEVVYPEAPGEGINVTISSLTNPGQVLYADVIASYGYWDIYAYNDQYEIEISNTSTTEAAGTYTIDDLDAKYTYIVPAEGDTVHFTAGQVVLSITDGVVNVAGKLTGDDNNIYNINLTYKDPVAEQTVNVNIPKGVLYDGYATSGLYAVYGSAGDGTYVQLAIWAEAGFEGEFTEDDLDNQYVGSGLKDAAGNSQQIYTAAITVTPGAIEGAYTITADLLCYNNTLYKVTMKIGEEQGIEDVEAAVKAIKRLVNGQVVIMKGDKTYNINGAVIR